MRCTLFLLLLLLIPPVAFARINHLGYQEETKESQIYPNKYISRYASRNQPNYSTQNGVLVDSFLVGKNNAKKLSVGKDNKQLLVYFKAYLALKDKARADTMSMAILNAEDNQDTKYLLSLIYYRFTGSTETNRLFLSPKSDIKKNRDYLLARGTKEIRGQNDMLWAYYYTIVQLDSVYSRVNKSDSLKLQMGQHCNSLAWSSLLTKQAGKARYYLSKSNKYDPHSKYFKTNHPHVLLFNGKYAKARRLYLKYKKLPFDHEYPTYKDVFLEDFKEFEKAGLTDSHLKEMAALLNSK